MVVLEKGNKFVTIIIFLVFFLLGGGIGFFINKSMTSESNATDNKSSNTEIKKDFVLYDVLSSLEKYNNLFLGKNSLSDISSEDLMFYTFYDVVDYSNKSNVSLETIKNAFSKSIFNEIELVPQDIPAGALCKDLIKYKYDSSSQEFVYQELGGHDCGMGSFPMTYDTFLYDFDVKDNKYVVTMYAVYAQMNNPGDYIYSYYGSYQDALSKSNPLFNSPYTEVQYDSQRFSNLYYDPIKNKISDDFNSYQSKLTKLSYTFEIKNGVLTLIDYSSSK